jgi:sugar (pentulose or hexulose) kinase
MRILGIDVGSSSIKAAVIDVEHAEIVGAISHVPYRLKHPSPEAAEVPADRLWAAIRTAASAVTATRSDAEAVGLCCLAPSLILLDSADRPLTSIWTHLDRRARAVALRIWREVGEEFLATIGNRPLPGGISAVCWQKQVEDDPDLLRKTKSYLHANGWLGLHLTGERAFDRANASFSGLYGTMTDQAWSDRWCNYFRVERDWLPPVVSGDTTIGALRSDIATELGVTAGVPVKLGTADTSSAMLLSGIQPGDLLHVVGTTQVVAALVQNPVPSEARLTRQLGVGEQFIQVAHNPVGGAALEWIRQLCFREQTAAEFYAGTIAGALSHPTLVNLDPPYLGGDRLEIEPQRAGFRGLTLTTDRVDLLAAVLHAMRQRHYEALEALGMGTRFARIFLTGGGSEVVQRLIPEYREGAVHPLEEGSLRGVARLFQQDGPAARS